jgi:hypothetical protein
VVLKGKDTAMGGESDDDGKCVGCCVAAGASRWSLGRRISVLTTHTYAFHALHIHYTDNKGRQPRSKPVEGKKRKRKGGGGSSSGKVAPVTKKQKKAAPLPANEQKKKKTKAKPKKQGRSSGAKCTRCRTCDDADFDGTKKTCRNCLSGPKGQKGRNDESNKKEVKDEDGNLVKRSKLYNDVSTSGAHVPCIACHHV